jgi:hypothetical protein
VGELRDAMVSADDQETREKLKPEIIETEKQADKALRRAAKAHAKAENPAREAEAPGVKSTDEQETGSKSSED